MIESLKQLLAHLYDVKGLIEWGGPVLVCVIVFIETGMFVGFFLPGDSLLVTAGVFAGAGHTSIATLCAAAAALNDVEVVSLQEGDHIIGIGPEGETNQPSDPLAYGS